MAPVEPEPTAAGVPVDVEAVVKSVGLAVEAARNAKVKRTAFEECVSRGSTFGVVQVAP